MKVLSAISKIVVALAFIAGIVYLIATYGDKIVAWAKKVFPCKFSCNVILETPTDAAEAAEEAAEEAAVETEEAEEAPVAEENDFEG